MAPRPAVFTATILLLLTATPAFAQQAVKAAPLRTDSEVVQKALKGDATAQFLVGLGYEMTGEVVNFEEAVKWYRKAADQGQPEAQNALGFLYQTGRGVPKDIDEAVRWYRKSADQGDPNGQSNLGKMYLDGTGVAQDSTQAANWYRKSAEQGWAWGQAELAHLYAAGNGAPADLVSAYMWCSLAAAAKQPHWGCKEMLLEIAPRMKPTEIAEAKQRAYAWFEQRSKDPKQKHWAVGPNTVWGLETDERWLTANLGLMYAEGDGVSKDDAEAVRWYQLGAQHGDAPAESYMGERYYLGKGVPKDHAQAFALFKSSAEQGYAPGQHNLATCYLQGIGIAKNVAEAVNWFRKAAEQGNALSMHDLGVLYDTGQGVDRSETEAVKWYLQAAERGDQTVLNNLAWLYATSSDSNVRNPEKALEYALKAVAATEEKKAGVLDTLAEAYFVNGRYKEAIETERKALALQPDDNLKQSLEKSLKKYEDAARGKKP